MKAAIPVAIAAAALAIHGCGPAMMDLDNHCVVEYVDGMREDIICSTAKERKPVFRSVEDGEIRIQFHDLSHRRIPMKFVRTWRFRYGDTDHWGRYVKVDGHWQRKGDPR